jgi:DNA mismatch repair protein MutL
VNGAFPSPNTRPAIRLLAPELRDQIAAGEVVERPASVVKELVENSLDAGARTVRIEIDGGGLDRITIVDDGHGMDRDGALLALERHATSKLHTFDDLYRLGTFGFRGEALPSIAGVSRFKLVTRPNDALGGTEIVVEPGEAPRVREVGAPVGTTIEVRDLFCNVPPRRKFLKSVGTEAGHVGDVALELALVRPDLALTLVRDGRVARQWLRAPDREARGRDALARALSGDPNGDPRALRHVREERGAVRVEALLSPPERARSGATGLHVLVNGRAIRDRQLARAVAMAYGSVLDPGRYPIGILWLDLPSDEVDVNVHPQKAEVRFARGRALYDDVTRALASALAETFRSPLSTSRSFAPSSTGPRSNPSPPNRAGATEPAREADLDPWGLASFAQDPLPPTRVAPTELSVPVSSEPSFDARASALADPDPRPADPPRTVTLQPPLILDGPRSGRIYGGLAFLAQVRSTYLLCEGPDGIYVLDQHAAAERVTFARLRDAHRARAVARQQLLVPEVVAVRAAEATLIDEAREEFLALGVDARAIGEGRVAVHGIPTILARRGPERILRDLLDELARTGERKFGDAIDLVLATMACHGSVRAGDALHPDECAALLRDLDAIDFAGYCPHGRPIVTILPFVDLEKKVGRR